MVQCRPSSFSQVLHWNTLGLLMMVVVWPSLCSFNRVDFPVYSSKEKMRVGLLKALDLGLVGFALR
jgi:hypothetical protein